MDIDVKEKSVTDAFCRCKQGNSGTCSHMLAVLCLLEQWKIAGYKEVPVLLSSTSLPQLWDKPRGPRIRSEPVSHIIFSRPGNVSRKRKPVMANYTDNRKVQVTNDQIARLKSLTASPISYLTEETTPDTLHVETPIGQQVILPLSKCPKCQANLMGSVYEELGCGDIQLPRDINLDPDTEHLITGQSAHWQAVSVTEQDCQEIEKQTRLQSNSKEWHAQRKTRITASKFGAIMNRKKKVNDAFLRNTFSQAPFISKPTIHGQVHEKTAKIMYVKKTGSHLHDVGLVINPKFPFLGASPDAIVFSR